MRVSSGPNWGSRACFAAGDSMGGVGSLSKGYASHRRSKAVEKSAAPGVESSSRVAEIPVRRARWAHLLRAGFRGQKKPLRMNRDDGGWPSLSLTSPLAGGISCPRFVREDGAVEFPSRDDRLEISSRMESLEESKSPPSR